MLFDNIICSMFFKKKLLWPNVEYHTEEMLCQVCNEYFGNFLICRQLGEGYEAFSKVIEKLNKLFEQFQQSF